MESKEIQIIRKESVIVQGIEPETNIITKYEIMNGGQIKNETIPIRFFLKTYDLKNMIYIIILLFIKNFY